jgi:hypothetical protein
MHLTAQITDVSEVVNLFLELEGNLLFVFDLFKYLLVWLQAARVVHDDIVDFLIVLLAVFCQLYVESNDGLVGQVVAVGAY